MVINTAGVQEARGGPGEVWGETVWRERTGPPLKDPVGYITEWNLILRETGGHWEFSDYHEDSRDHQCCHHSCQQLSS